MKTCPYCEAEIANNAKKCKFCGEIVVEEKEVRLCPYCEAEVSETAKKCKFCGEWIDEQSGTENLSGKKIIDQQNNKETFKKRKIGYFKYFIVIVVIIIALIIGGIYYDIYLAKSQLTDVAFRTLERIENFVDTENKTYKDDFLRDYNECIEVKNLSSEEKTKLNCLYNLSTRFAMFCGFDAIKNGESNDYYNKDDLCREFDHLRDLFFDTKERYPESFDSWLY